MEPGASAGCPPLIGPLSESHAYGFGDGLLRALVERPCIRELSTAAFGVTYQFRENAMVHPYVSAGVEVHRLAESRERLFRVGNSTTWDAAERSTHVRTRPYVGGGVKFYFNRRLFARTELIWGQSRMVEAGMGADF